MTRWLVALLSPLFLAAPLVATAQLPGRVARIGVLCSVLCTPEAMRAFHQGIQARGFVEERNVIIDLRREDQDADRIDAFARELIGKPVDVLVAIDMTPAMIARYQSRTVPIVAGLRDPTVLGRLRPPASNVTGISFVWPELNAKRLQLLKEAVPHLTRVGVIWPHGLGWYAGTEEATRALGLTLHRVDVSDAADLDNAFAFMVQERVTGFVVGPHSMFVLHRGRVAELAVKHRLPAIYELREQAEAGGLLAYGPSAVQLFARAADQAAKILGGAKPADVPIEQPARLELTVNLKTAKALGLTIPQSMLLRADEVIQ